MSRTSKKKTTALEAKLRDHEQQMEYVKDKTLWALAQRDETHTEIKAVDNKDKKRSCIGPERACQDTK
jgi:hypothetical protein